MGQGLGSRILYLGWAMVLYLGLGSRYLAALGKTRIVFCRLLGCKDDRN
jgi:hypothetical protein